MPQTLCLNMIVKNEAPVIRRCLESVLPLIDHWVIVDTGSTDGTQDIVRAFFAERGLPGSLHERPWRDFAHNRSEALTLARPHGDYTLIVDADDTFDVPDGFKVPELTADSYVVDITDVGVLYQRPQLVRNALPWRYRGVLHEFLTCDGAGAAGHFPVVMRRNHDGARRRDPETYRRDAALLETALAGETDPFLRSRYTFYLAQSYRDCGEREKAIPLYLARADMGFWEHEVYVALYQAGKLMEALGRPDQEIIDVHARAADFLGTRAEALHAAARWCRLHGRHAEGHAFARRGLGLTPPRDGLFVEAWIYEYGLLDELSGNAFGIGHYRDSLDASLLLLAGGKTPDRDRIMVNAQLALKNLPDKPV